MKASKMVSAQPRLKAFVEMIGFALIAVLLGALVRTGTASAQCGPAAGIDNTACGSGALHSNTTGGENTASGVAALFGNTRGNNNTASGVGALFGNTRGSNNTASGVNALGSNTTGGANTASGEGALFSNTTGDSNIGLGSFAGSNIVAGSNNIEIGGAGTADESTTIRIGIQGLQTATFIAGISGTPISEEAAVVVVSSTGQLGVATSSARYKRDIRDMGGASACLMKLRPVAFRYKNDPSGTLQYGLVAEEVARVYPELVTRGSDGKPLTVRYLEFTALLLNELQRQTRDNKELSRENRELRSEVAQVRAEQTRERAGFDGRLSALERSVRASPHYS
jgi:Chaperone of endosialidase